MYKFIKTIDESNQFDNTNVEVTIPYNDLDLTTLMESFEDFLRGCSFSFNGHLEIVPEEE